MSDNPVTRGPNYDWKHEAAHYEQECEKLRKLLYEVEASNDQIDLENFKLKQINLHFRTALEQIAAVTYGTEFCNTDEENNEINARHLFAKQHIAREALKPLYKDTNESS